MLSEKCMCNDLTVFFKFFSFHTKINNTFASLKITLVTCVVNMLAYPIKTKECFLRQSWYESVSAEIAFTTLFSNICFLKFRKK